MSKQLLFLLVSATLQRFFSMNRFKIKEEHRDLLRGLLQIIFVSASTVWSDSEQDEQDDGGLAARGFGGHKFLLKFS